MPPADDDGPSRPSIDMSTGCTQRRSVMINPSRVHCALDSGNPPPPAEAPDHLVTVDDKAKSNSLTQQQLPQHLPSSLVGFDSWERPKEWRSGEEVEFVWRWKELGWH